MCTSQFKIIDKLLNIIVFSLDKLPFWIYSTVVQFRMNNYSSWTFIDTHTHIHKYMFLTWTYIGIYSSYNIL